MAVYADRDYFYALLGGARRAGDLAGLSVEALDTQADLLLEGATARMNEAFEAADYAVPIEPSTSSSPADTAALLRERCASLAAGRFRFSVAEVPKGLAALSQEAEEWLRDIRSGQRKLLGMTKTTEAVASTVAGSLVFVSTGETIPRSLYATMRRIGGF